MGLYEKWDDLTKSFQNKKMADEFWKEYFAAEQKNYEKILESGINLYEGTVSELAGQFDMDNKIFMGFLDGINTSLTEPLDLESLEEDTPVRLEIDFEKLFWNMHEAKADWLYSLEQWEGVLPADKRGEISRSYSKSKMAVSDKVGRNEPCPCGSGKKYKNCCGA